MKSKVIRGREFFDASKYLVWLLVGLIALPSVGFAGLVERERAKRIFDRLTGETPSNTVLDTMEGLIVSGDPVAAARYAIDGDADANPNPTTPNFGFYNVTLKNWAMPWTNEDFNVFAPLNDYVATVIGMVRDERDFRQLLFGDILYTGNVSPAYSNSNNQHYIALESSGNNMGELSVLQQTTQTAETGIDPNGAAGIFSTRAAARAFFVDGTNRAMFRFTLVNHLCTDLEQLQDTGRPSDRIRQDVSRSPGGDSQIFLNNCISCHNGMDPLAQAFAYYQFEYTNDNPDAGRLIYTPGFVQPKYLINDTTFQPGYITPNDHWTNYWRLGPNSEKLGWLLAPANSGAVDMALDPEYSEGDGAASLGMELANTEAFAHCQVKKVFQNVCLREPGVSDRTQFNQFVTNFKSGYNVKNVFAEVAAYCASHL